VTATGVLRSLASAISRGSKGPADAWQDRAPIRADLFGIERLEHHAESLAAAQQVAPVRPPRVRKLRKRVRENADVLLDAYRICAKAVQEGQPIVPAAEWLLDNFHLVEQQLRQIGDDLPPGYYRQLPKLSDGPFAGYPRVFGLAWAYVAHTDSLLSGQVLRRYVKAYQHVQPLTIGELWAVAITLRIVLIENMRRLAVEIVGDHALRLRADQLVDEVLSARAGAEHSQTLAFQKAISPYESLPLSETVAAQIAKRLRGYDPAQMPLLTWLEERLHRDGRTIDDVVTQAQSRMGASNVSMRNIVTSMRLISDMDWAEFFEDVSVIDARLGAATGFGLMDFATRNRYRTEIEILARGAGQSELAVTDTCLRLAAEAEGPRDSDPGHWLIGRGRPVLEAALSFRRSPGVRLRRWMGRRALPAYLAAIGLVAAAFLAPALALAQAGGAGLPAVVALAITGIAVAIEAATAVVNTVVTRSAVPHPLPARDLAKGIPPDLRTLVAVPVLLHDATLLLRQIEQLEVHYLSSVGGALHYALLSDFADANTESTEGEAALKDMAFDAIRRLNLLYPSDDGARFFFLHRRRQWNPAQGVWMGWERKRGKLMELNRLLRGARDTSFTVQSDPLPQDIRYVITLDADTRLLRDTVHRLIGKMAHPLNHARLDGSARRVVDGYGIMQPRVSAALPLGAEGSVYQRIFSSPGGIEPYAAATSDLYQDLFGEGSFTGKGIYDVDAFSAALAGRVPENTLLSHDLFEGVFARAALASDVEVIEDFPTRYDADVSRHHRWARGDWQLLPWIFGKGRPADGGLTPLGRWKMIDNLRRSLLAPMVLATLLAGWLIAPAVALVWTVWTLLMLALPRLLPLPFGIVPTRTGVTLRSHLAALAKDTRIALAHVAFVVAFLADSAAVMLDAIVRTVWRLAVSRRHLLEWVTAEQARRAGAPTLASAFARMAPGVAAAPCLVALVHWVSPGTLPLALPFCIVWFLAPALAAWLSRPVPAVRPERLTPEQRQALRSVARRTWRYFETFVTEEENFLPPDNFQETPKPEVASRTSPTNIGLYLLATVAAHDLGWIGRTSAARRLRDTLATLERMQRFRGHLYNWYDTRDLRPLDPPYVSSVDSGNLAGHLVAVSQSCREWLTSAPKDHDVRQALLDSIALARESLPSGAETEQLSDRLAVLARWVDDGAAPLGDVASQLAAIREQALAVGGECSEAAYWVGAAGRSLADHLADRAAPADPALLEELAARARRLAMDMDFGFLFEPDKKLLLIGFSVATNRPDANCYDLLASEARLASLFAIAKGDVETRHWFRLGRTSTPLGASSALISWSGSMFEYLMPSLVMRAPEGSMLAETSRMVVARQQAYGAAIGIPWGISESAFNARDLEMTYQYSNFGVPGLGLKRGLSENRVVAPYATGLAAMVDSAAAARNYRALAALGAEGRYGFYEAVDFTPSRLQTGEDYAIVRSFMAHHQAMTVTAIANMVQGGRLRDRFHAEPMIQAADLLLQERVPRDVAIALPRATEVTVAPGEDGENPGLRTFAAPAEAVPTGHILSNGSYGVMLTPTGEGYSRWRDIAVTRWRAEPTQATFGSFIFLRETAGDPAWSAAVQPTGEGRELHRAAFSEHHAAFTHQAARLTTTTEVVVSAEDDAEARRVTLTNTGRGAREIDVTSYAELVLAPLAADIAHPAFSKLFVVTDHLPELGVIIATRRRRSPEEPEVWAAHIAVVEGEETAPIQIETDRARFIGRGRTIGDAAMARAPLSGTVGTVLDPIFSIRRRVSVPPGGTTRITFWTMVATSPEALLDLVDRHRDPSAFARAATLAWTQMQVQLRHLEITHAEAAEFQTLGGMILRNDARLRASPARIAAGAGPQSTLWPWGISGDLPIVVLQIEDVGDIAALHQALSAHEYWNMRGLAADLVILNDRSSSYVQDLQNAIDAAARAARSRPGADHVHAPARGSIHTLRADLMNREARDHLIAVARVILVASRGGIGAHLRALRPAAVAAAAPRRLPPEPAAAPPVPDLEFFNGLGGFADRGREYVTVLGNGRTTPAPWINVIANPRFGFQVSAEGAGFVWSENSRENQITPWSNDPVSDPPGEAIYLHDPSSDQIWTPTALPIRGRGTYVARHGFGYSAFHHTANGIASEMTQFVPLEGSVKVTRLRLRNTGATRRRLNVTAYAEWSLGSARSTSAPHVLTWQDPVTGALLAKNTFTTAFPGLVAFADLGGLTDSLSADRAEFLGTGGTLASPAGLGNAALSGRTGAGLDPCAALRRKVALDPGETVEILFLLGEAESADAASALVARMRAEDPARTLDQVRQFWADQLTAVQITSPDRAADILLNGWLLYQTLACRFWARAGFYQASGAYGFRDQLQDGMALAFSRPDLTRAHLLRAAARQFPEGDVQHWWLPHSGQGVRTRISDDRVWLGHAVAHYVSVSGDEGILDEQVPFLHGPPLLPGVHDDFAQPTVSEAKASLFEHCALGLDQAILLTGDNGMPLIGTGDWNDGMNRVGDGGKGTSVWLGWLLIATLECLAPIAGRRDPERAARWRAHARSVKAAIETHGWDGEWYRRGTFDDGTILGSAGSDECQIDSIAQTWAVLSGAAPRERATRAMASFSRRLVRRDPGLALLFTPPFDRTPLDPGYIKGYPPGLRENGGQYSHAAMWAVLAQARLGNGDAAGDLFALLNPINHASSPPAAERYKVEPYVVAADVYSAGAHEGRGGWTWYTGSAAWMYRAGIEGLLGLTRRGACLHLAPCFPAAWPEVSATVRLGRAHYEITILNPHQSGRTVAQAIFDDRPLPVLPGGVEIPLADGSHRVTVTLGQG